MSDNRNRNQRGPRRRRSARGQQLMNQLQGTTRCRMFQTVCSRVVLSAAAAGVNANPLTIAQLMNSDLAQRQVKLVRIVCRFHPTNQTTTPASHYSAQIQYTDPLAPTVAVTPISIERPLNSSVITTLSGHAPYQALWTYANTATNIINIPIWAQSVLGSGILVDISAWWLVAQDNLD
jgi:hypothetical protein